MTRADGKAGGRPLLVFRVEPRPPAKAGPKDAIGGRPDGDAAVNLARLLAEVQAEAERRREAEGR